jgi:rhodanese-related sulfurtransferase
MMMESRRSVLAIAIAAFVAVHIGTADPAAADSSTRLQAAIEDVAARWPTQRHITPGELAALMRDGSAVIFDVRAPEEYAVSHLEGAIRVDAGLTRAAFLSENASKLNGKLAVFYCSVGVRSSKLAERVGEAAFKAAGATGSANLAGGIFAWHGEQRPLADANGATQFVHGYDRTWSQLVKRQDLISNDAKK